MRSRRRACGASTANVLQTPPSSLLRHLCIEVGAYSAAGHFRAYARRSLGNLWLRADPDCAQAASPHRSDPFCPAPCRPAATRRENTMTVQCAANCVRSRTLAAQCGGAVYLRSPGRTRATELEYPWLCAWSSSTSLRAAGLHTHVLTHRTSRDPADLHTYVYLYMKREEEECCSGYFRNPGLKRTFG